MSSISDYFDVREKQIKIEQSERKTIVGLEAAKAALEGGVIVAKALEEKAKEKTEKGIECLPKVAGVSFDPSFAARCIIVGAGETVRFLPNLKANLAEIAIAGLEPKLKDVELQGEIKLRVLDSRLEIADLVRNFEALMREEPLLRIELAQLSQMLQQAEEMYRNAVAEGDRLVEEWINFRKTTAGAVQEYRFEDMAFRVFRNDALQKYRAALDLAARYTYLAATAYDYDTNLIGSDGRAGEGFLTDIVRERSVGQLIFGVPVAGSPGLADPIARMDLNFQVLKGQMGFNNPQVETNRFSLRREHFGIRDDGAAGDQAWKERMQRFVVPNLWDVPEFRRFARPFAPESTTLQPGLVIPFDTTVTFGLNFFGEELGARDSAYDPTNFATRVRAVGVWLDDYENLPLSATPQGLPDPGGCRRAARRGGGQLRDAPVVRGGPGGQLRQLVSAIGNQATAGRLFRQLVARRCSARGQAGSDDQPALPRL